MERRYIMAIIALSYPFLLFLFSSVQVLIPLFLLSILFSIPSYVIVLLVSMKKVKSLRLILATNYTVSFLYLVFLVWVLFWGVAAPCGSNVGLYTQSRLLFLWVVASGIFTIFSYPGLPLSLYTLSILKPNLNERERMVSLLRVILFFVVLTIAGGMLQ